MISKKILNALTKEQLIFLINQYQYMEFVITEICVNENKQHIPSEQTVEKIRKELRNCNFPFCTPTEELELAERRQNETSGKYKTCNASFPK